MLNSGDEKKGASLLNVIKPESPEDADWRQERMRYPA
jgi:hypothetical protein